MNTCVSTQQPGADERGEGLARFGQQSDHPEEQCRGGLLPLVHHEVFVHQVRNDQFQELTRSLCKHPVTGEEEKLDFSAALQNRSMNNYSLCSLQDSSTTIFIQPRTGLVCKCVTFTCFECEWKTKDHLKIYLKEPECKDRDTPV